MAVKPINDIVAFSAEELAMKLANGELTAQTITNAFIEQIKSVDNEINAFIVTTFDEAIMTAKIVDDLVKSGVKRAKFDANSVKNWQYYKPAIIDKSQNCEIGVNEAGELHPLAGVPIAVKDVVVTKGIQTTAGSKMLEGWIPPYDATINLKIKHAGMPILGKTNMDEFAMGSSTEHSAYGNTLNPLDVSRIPGGSGGGSAAAVAAFEAPIAIGTDTGGSIRQPAAMTGTVGVKPTYGAVSRYGLIAMASSLDQAGPVARNVIDSAILQDLIGGHDYHDSTSLTDNLPSNYAAALEAKSAAKSATKSTTSAAENSAPPATTLPLDGVKIGVIDEFVSGETANGFAPKIRECFENSIKKFKSLGAQIITVSCPNFKYSLGAYYLIMPSEASSNLAKFDGMRYGNRVDGKSASEMMHNTRGELFGQEVKRRIILGTYALSSGHYTEYYGLALKVRTLILQDFENAFKQCDFLITPTAPSVAFKFGEKLDDPLMMYLNDIATIPANLAGTPGISIPNGIAEDNMPSGLQILAPQKADAALYRVSAAYECVQEK